MAMVLGQRKAYENPQAKLRAQAAAQNKSFCSIDIAAVNNFHLALWNSCLALKMRKIKEVLNVLSDLYLLLKNLERSRSKIKITFCDLDHDLKITYIL